MKEISYWSLDDSLGGIGDIVFLVAFPFIMGSVLIMETIFVLAGEDVWKYYYSEWGDK